MDTAQLLKCETVFHWMAFFSYVFSSVFFIHAVAFETPKAQKIGFWLALIGLVPHSVALGVRWYAVGHGPYLLKLESFSSLAYGAVFMFLLSSYKAHKLRSVGFVVLPCCVLSMAIGFLSESRVAEPPPSFQGLWFIIHTTSIIFAMGAFLISLGAAILFLLKKRGREGKLYEITPTPEILDTYSYKFAGFGFLFWAIMVASGALWADESWGRYWAWDPIETWSLITWLLFGLYLHLRRFYRWKGTKAAWLMIICFVFAIITLFFTPLVMKTIHSEFLL